MKPVLVIIITFLSYQTIGNAPSTAQIPDIINFRGKEFALNSNPLEAYFENNQDRRPQGGMMSTALWRGYVATFAIVDSLLVVKDIEIEVANEKSKDRYSTKWISAYDQVFPSPLRKVDWYSGILILPYGKLLNYVHMGYASTYSKYWLLEVVDGELTESRKYNHKEFVAFKERQLNVFMKSEEYMELFNNLKNEGYEDDELIRSFIRDYVTNYTTTFLDN